jgi:hypothetical protein
MIQLIEQGDILPAPVDEVPRGSGGGRRGRPPRAAGRRSEVGEHLRPSGDGPFRRGPPKKPKRPLLRCKHQTLA